MMKNQRLIQSLENSDLNGNKEDFYYHVHGLCPYPARMHPYVTRTLIKQLTEKNSFIYEPYCGSGTVLVESMLSGNYSVGIDANPLAVLMSKVKTTPLKPISLMKTYKKIVLDLEKNKDRLFLDELPFDTQSVHLHYWFKVNTIRKLSVIHHLLNSEWLDFDNKTHDFLRLSFARLVREVSTVRKNEFKLYRKSEENMKNYTPRVFQTYLEILKDNISRMSDFYYIVKTNGLYKYKPRVYNGSNEFLCLSHKADLVITSPPYGDNRTTISYGQFSRYPLLWLGFSKNKVYKIDELPETNPEITDEIKLLNECKTYKKISKKINEKDNKRALEVEKYFVSIFKSLGQISESLSNGGKLCMIIGPRTVRNIIVPNDKIIAEMGTMTDLHHVHSIERNISFKRLPSRNAGGSTILREKVMILEKR